MPVYHKIAGKKALSMTCNLAKREPVIDLGRWRVTLADLDELSHRLKKPRSPGGSWVA
jgi:hypothetical protein